MGLKLALTFPGEFRAPSGARTVLTVRRGLRLLYGKSGRGEKGDADGRDIEAVAAILPTAWLTAFVAIVSMVLVWRLDLIKEPIRLAYLGAAFAVLPMVMILWAATSLIQIILAGGDKPISEMWNRLRYRAPMMVLALLIFPLFLAAFTICKSSIPILVGFGWDRAFARADLELLGTDAWRLTHQWIGPKGTIVLEAIYTVVWGIAFAFVGPLIAMLASRRTTGQFFLAMILTWMFGGLICATFFAAAGPVFAQLSDPVLGQHFAALQQTLARSLPPNSLIRETQHYLQTAAPYRYVVKGGGISAMPSMHVAVATIYVLASNRTLFARPALLFWALILIGSVHFGYHYFVDGIFGTFVALICWSLARWWFNKIDSRERASIGNCGDGCGRDPSARAAPGECPECS